MREQDKYYWDGVTSHYDGSDPNDFKYFEPAVIEDDKISSASTYSSEKIMELITEKGFTIKVVDELPETGENNTIYFVPCEESGETDVYEEYIWVDGKYEKIGTTKVNLDDYYTKEETNTLLDSKQNVLSAGTNVTISGNVISATDTTYVASDFDIKDLSDSTELRAKWDNKQNALSAGTNVTISADTISVDLSNYYTTAQTDTIIDDMSYVITNHIVELTNRVDSLEVGKSNTGHTHVMSDISGLTEALDGKSNTGHTHTAQEVGALPDDTFIPEKISDLTDDISIVTSESASSVSGLSLYVVASTPIADKTSDTATTFDIEPNIMYMFGEKTSLTVNLVAGEPDVVNEYMFQFTSGSVATTLNVPNTVVWLKDPDIQTGKKYAVSIENNLGVIGEWNNE